MVGHFGAKEEKDWNFVNENLHGKCAGILVSPDKECRIPVFYKRNSLSVLACVRRVETTVHSIRGVTVTFKMDVSKLVEGWQFLQNGNLCHLAVSTATQTGCSCSFREFEEKDARTFIVCSETSRSSSR